MLTQRQRTHTPRLLAIALLAALVSGFAAPGAQAEHDGDAACPEDLRLTGLRAGVVLLNWTHAPDSDASLVYRTEGEGDPQLIASIESDENDFFADEETEFGATYTYEVRALYGEHESSDCPTETTTIQFPGPPHVCPTGFELMATAEPDGSILVDAGGLDRDARLMRSGPDGERELAMLNETRDTYHDHDTEPTTTYTYSLHVGDDLCSSVQVTAVPFFGGAVALLIAGLAAAGPYVAYRRRS